MASLSVRKQVLDLVVIDSPGALASGRFYSDLLGWPFEDGASGELLSSRRRRRVV